MKKIIYIVLALVAVFVNSNVYAAEARTTTTCFSEALQSVKSRDNFANLKSAKFNLKEKTYNISYLTKDGSVETIKISQISGKEVR